MDNIWVISYWDRGTNTTDVESAWASQEEVIAYLKKINAKPLADDWLWSWENDQGDSFELSVSHIIVGEPGWLDPHWP